MVSRERPPGSPDGIRGLARRWRGAEGGARGAAGTLRSAASDIGGPALGLRGDYAAKIRDGIAEVPDALEKLARGYGGCAAALEKYATTLEESQRIWDKAARDFDGEQVQVNSARMDLDRIQPGLAERLESPLGRVHLVGPHADEINAAWQRYQRAKDVAARHDRLALQARDLRDGAENACRVEIEQALRESGTKNLSWWEKAKEWAKTTFTTWDGFVKFCETLGTVLAIVALFASGPFALVVGAILLATAIVAMADKVRKLMNGEITWKDLAFEAVMVLGQRVGGRYIGKAYKALQKTNVSKTIAKWGHAGVDKLGDKLNDTARNAAHRTVCAVTGHPVDIATGKVFTSFTDLELLGPLPLQFERVWYSTSAYVGPFGHGWHHTFDAALYVTSDAASYRTPDGRFSSFAPLEVGEEFYDRQDQWTIIRDEGAYRVRGADGITRRFTPTPQDESPQDATSQDQPTGTSGIQDRLAGDADGRPPGDSEPDMAAEEEPVMYLLREVVSRAGHRITLEYDDRDRLVQIVDSGGREIRLDLDAAGRITALTAPHPDDEGERFTVASYSYTPEGDLADMTDARGFVFSYGYSGHLLTRETDRTGLTFTFEYDTDGIGARCIRTSGDGDLYRRTLTYEPGVTVVVDSLGHATRNEHDGVLVTRTINALGGTRATTYRDAKPIEETDELGRVTMYDYDWRGNLIAVTTPDGSTVEVDFDEYDQPVRAVDQVDGEWRWEYDDAGLLILRRDPLGRVTHLSYARGLLESIVDPAGGRTTMVYDDQRSLVEVTTPDGAISAWRRNALGWPVAATDPLGKVMTRTFDLGGNVVRVDEPDGNVRELAYDGESNLGSAIDELYDVRLTYQGMGRLAERMQAGTTVRFEYDTEEQLLGIVNEHGYVYSFTYGPTGLVSTERGFDGIMRIYERDIAGRVASVRRASGTITRHEYDDLDRVVRVAHSDGTAQRYAYRADGALMAAGNDTIAVTFERDVLGRLLRETQGSRWVASAYDEFDRRIRMTSSMGADQTITRNAMGDVMAVSGNGYSATFTRDALGQELTRSLRGGVEARWHRDRIGRPVRQEVVGVGGVVRERTYDWDVGGRLRGILDSMAGPVRYEHDGLGQLMSATYGDGRIELRMPDAVGNLFRTQDRSDREYGAAGQVLSLIDEHGRRVRYDYDPEGNLISKVADDGEMWRYRWAADGNMSAVERPDGTVVTFGYDALSRRVWKSYRGQTTHWVWDGDVILHEWVDGELEPGPVASSDDAIAAARDALLNEVLRRGPPDRGTESSPITWLFDPETFAPAARIHGAEASSFVTDHLGTPHTLWAADGRGVWLGTPSTYGQMRTLDGDGLLNPFRFPGQYEDTESGLCYNRHRYYDLGSGRYTSADPIGLVGGMARYGYPANPTGSYDPLGLQPCGGVSRTGSAAKSVDVLPTPVVESTKLQNIVNNLYKGTTNPNRVGNGTTMDAIRSELATGAPTGGRMHLTKGQESLRGLDNWLAKNPDAPYYDRLVAQSLADELRGVLPR